VWLARDLSPLSRLVALKFLRPSASAQREEQALAVLRNEARVLASLRHPNVVQVHAWKHAPGAGPCLVLQYVPGGSLDQHVIRHGPLGWSAAARYVADVADGLLLVHGKGVIHRDVKPANFLLDAEADEALLTDFGIAARLVEPGAAAGTPRYLAPEAFRGETSAAQDVYGLAASLFWLVTGAAPFDGEDASAIYEAAVRGLPAIDARFAGVPEPLEGLIRAGLDADAGRRPSLPAFVRRLRGELNMLLADSMGATLAPGELRLIVSRRGADGVVPVASSMRQPSAVRDLKRVPRPPQFVKLRTGDRVSVEVRADQPGYVTVFNVGPTGNLNLLYPHGPAEADSPVAAGQGLVVLDAELVPPAGRERLFAVWTRRPLGVRMEELLSLVERGDVPASGAYRATRDMARVQQSVDALPAADRQAVVLELEHS
jgi:serine/threonine protein kinase